MRLGPVWQPLFSFFLADPTPRYLSDDVFSISASDNSGRPIGYPRDLFGKRYLKVFLGCAGWLELRSLLLVIDMYFLLLADYNISDFS